MGFYSDYDTATNAQAVATIAAVAGYAFKGKSLAWSYSATPTNGAVRLKKGSTIVLEVRVTAAGPGFLPIDGYVTDFGESLSAEIDAGGASVIGHINLVAEDA